MNKKKVVLASGNLGKLKEMQYCLHERNIELIAQGDLNVPEADEVGLTYVENAILKARGASYHTKLPAIADDSGLSVDALNGEPGIYSARYAGENATSSERIEKLLSALDGENNRSASFYSVIVFMRNESDPAPIIAQGIWKGEILKAPQGEGGFGYDPVFFVPTHQCSAAELTAAVKNQISHRAQALKELKKKGIYTHRR